MLANEREQIWIPDTEQMNIHLLLLLALYYPCSKVLVIYVWIVSCNLLSSAVPHILTIPITICTFCLFKLIISTKHFIPFQLLFSLSIHKIICKWAVPTPYPSIYTPFVVFRLRRGSNDRYLIRKQVRSKIRLLGNDRNQVKLYSGTTVMGEENSIT